MHAPISVYVKSPTHIHTYTHTYTYAQDDPRESTNAHTHIHTYTHIYTHAYAQDDVREGTNARIARTDEQGIFRKRPIERPEYDVASVRRGDADVDRGDPYARENRGVANGGGRGHVGHVRNLGGDVNVRQESESESGSGSESEPDGSEDQVCWLCVCVYVSVCVFMYVCVRV